jgi:gluconokinase
VSTLSSSESATASKLESGIESGDAYIVSLDVGTSSVRALLYDSSARQMEGYRAHLPYRIHTTPDGGAEIDPEELAQHAIDCLDELHRQIQAAGFRIAAVAGSAFWHSFCGVDRAGKPTLPILHLLDTRSAAEVPRVPDTHASTGCVPHSSYWPAKLLWLERNRGEQFRATHRWLSFPEYLFEKLFGEARVSTSMASATGLWNQSGNNYDYTTLAALPIRREQLADPSSMDRPFHVLREEYRGMWPAYSNIPWFPAIGDGAANHIGSGCLRPPGPLGEAQFSLMVGTTGAMRALVSSPLVAPMAAIPPGLWCYRLDPRRAILGGALSNGGEVYAWLKRTLALRRDTEAQLETAVPGGHGLTVLPFFAGERSPYWRADLRGVIAGLSLDTGPFEILHASLESVALRFRDIYGALVSSLGVASEVIASGGGLLHSPAWTQMMADSLGRPVVASTEFEASCRGAALYALERIGTIPNLEALPASTGATFSPRPQFEPVYARLLEEQRGLYEKLFGSHA